MQQQVILESFRWVSSQQKDSDTKDTSTHSSYTVTCDASHPTPHIFIVLLASPPVAVLVLLIPHLQLFFLTPLCPRLWRHYCSHVRTSTAQVTQGLWSEKWRPSLLEQSFPQGCWRTLLKNLGDHQYSPCELQSTSCFQWKGLESPDMKMNAFGCCICSLTMTMSVCQLQVTCWPREECKQLGRWEWQ